MKSDIDLKGLWAAQKTEAPDMTELFLQVKKFKQANMKRLIITNIMLMLTAAFIVFVWVYFQPQFLSSKIGILMIIIAMAVFLFAYNKSYSLFKNDMQGKSNSNYLKDLLIIKEKQKYLQTTMLNLYFVLLSTGIALYMYEYTIRMSIFWGAFTYGVTAGWILLNWFYFRPKQIKQQERKLDEVIRKFEMLKEQLEQKQDD